jgi:hypothetical protein
VEREAEFRKLVAVGSDYDELLRMGHVARRPEDIHEWRSRIRAQARVDRIKVRTGISTRDPTVVWAYLKHLDHQELTETQQDSMSRHLTAVEEAFERVRLRGHNVRRVLRAENDRAAAVCEVCGARLYLDWSESPTFMEGEVFEMDCPIS